MTLDDLYTKMVSLNSFAEFKLGIGLTTISVIATLIFSLNEVNNEIILIIYLVLVLISVLSFLWGIVPMGKVRGGKKEFSGNIFYYSDIASSSFDSFSASKMLSAISTGNREIDSLLISQVYTHSIILKRKFFLFKLGVFSTFFLILFFVFSELYGVFHEG